VVLVVGPAQSARKPIEEIALSELAGALEVLPRDIR